ncbi:von Willebrand factor C and EGF domain-containing protein isoform X2 [Pseudophryne corroboree]|uniref:von Willebrand factor C and EGF domain-containing protein isoform X2 n=1 Tax=Pseudophryne corroboree TaxID=495146 RepID=UPI0030818F9D
MVPFWMRVSFILLLTSGREGRIYNGRKKPPALTAQRLRSGPHVCFSGMGSGCCPGWTVSPGTGLCLQPLCSYGCGSGFCIAPNVCSCRDGHQGVTCTDHYTGEHEKEFEGFSLNCLSAMCDQGCKVIHGNAVCSCLHGYSLGKDGKSCYDVDECSRSQTSSLCQQQCKNNIGSYRCLCYYGYQISPNGRSCLPIKHPNTIAASALCGEYGCELACNDGGCEHVSRVCPVGFRMTETTNGVTCTDIDECAASSCEGTCLNTEGGYMCDCGSGLKLAADRRSCLDIDECSSHRSICTQRCKNFHGSYRCLCDAGFTLQSNGRTCADINECRRPGTAHLCQHFCRNTHGSFFCSCRTGFALSADRVSCVDVNECLENATLCYSGSCINTLGSYVCSCPAGFLSISGGCLVPPETQTASFLQAVHSDWALLKPTSSMPLRLGTPTFSASQTMMPITILTQEVFTTKSTSKPQTTTTNLDPLPPPQHLKTGHLQKSSGISHMPLKENIIMPTGTPTAMGTNASCWHNKELRLSGSSWTEPECLECTCQEGMVSCEKRVCNPSCSHPVLHPDSCCPSCDGCLFEGTVRADGELFPNSPDNCTICICLAGNITCIPPVCPSLSCAEPYMLDCCLQCPDSCEFQGSIYPHGAKFSRDENGCTSCLCQNGAVECSFVPCPSLECPREDWVLETGQCCFKCQDPLESTGCPFDDNGIEIPVGQIWSPGDPCSICICQADGSIVCRKTDCVETCPHPIPVPGQCCPDCSAGCSYGRKTFKNNESFPSSTDSCLTCICLMGTVACSPVECAPSCTYPFHDEGDCCPVCRDCTYDGRKVLNRQTFSLESEPCTQCTCQDGEVQCEAISCSVSCSHPYIFPGECCTTCEECTFEGHVLENGSSYIRKVNPCVVCHCYAGNVQCEQREGPCTPCEQKTQDCLNEVPDNFYTNAFQTSQQDTVLQEANMPLKPPSFTKPPGSSSLSLSQQLVLSRNLVTTVTSSASHSSVPHTEVPYPNVAHGLQTADNNAIHNTQSVSGVQFKINTDFVQYIKDDPVSHADIISTTQSKDNVYVSVSTSTTFPNQAVPHSSATSHTLPTTRHSTSTIAYDIVSYTNVPPSILSMSSSSITEASFSPGTSTSSIHPPENGSVASPKPTILSGTTVKDKKFPMSYHDLGKLSPWGKNTYTALMTTKAPGGAVSPSRPSGHFHHMEDTSKHTLPKLENTEMKHYDSVNSKECSLNGRSYTNGSIYISDVDHCLQCECLKEEIYCRPDTHFPTGLCCRGCYTFPLESCSGENNQIHSEWREGRKFCKCQNVILQCRTCSYRYGCSTEGTSQSSESEQSTKSKINWVALVIEDELNLGDENSKP